MENTGNRPLGAALGEFIAWAQEQYKHSDNDGWRHELMRHLRTAGQLRIDADRFSAVITPEGDVALTPIARQRVAPRAHEHLMAEPGRKYYDLVPSTPVAKLLAPAPEVHTDPLADLALFMTEKYAADPQLGDHVITFANRLLERTPGVAPRSRPTHPR